MKDAAEVWARPDFDWRDLIAAHLAANPFRPPAEKDKFFWPLARPNLTAADIVAALAVLLSGHTTCWREVAAFEAEFAERFAPGRAAVMVNSGSSANLLAAELLARRIGRGAEVLIPAVTWPTHVWAALQVGLKVRLCDVRMARWTAGPADFEDAATPDTRAVWPVHPLGLVADMPGIRALAAHRGWTVLEDCCDALGSRDALDLQVGARSLAATFSFFMSHALSTLEGGMVVCDAEDAPALRAWRSHGWSRNLGDTDARRVLEGRGAGAFTFCDTGWNLRPTEVQAAIGRSQLARWDRTVAARAEQVAWWRSLLGQLQTITDDLPADGTDAAFTRSNRPKIVAHLPVIQPGDALHGLPLVGIDPYTCGRWLAACEAAGIETRPILAGDLREQPAVKVLAREGRLTWPAGDWIGTKIVHGSAMYLGLLPGSTPEELRRLADTLRVIASQEEIHHA